MPEVVDHLAELTGQRDRDVMDVGLVSALRDLLKPQSVAIYRRVALAGGQHWLTRARLAQGDAAPTADPLWATPDQLPAAHDFPYRVDCLNSRGVVRLRAKPPGGIGTPSWVAAFPLLIEGEASGVLEVITVRAMESDAQRMVSSMLRIYHNFQVLLDSNERDVLTGLLNRRTFEERLKKALAEVPAADDKAEADGGRRRQRPPHVYLGVVDIDNFKQVNDVHGHLAGDEALSLLARLMRQSFRFSDLLYRFGGEEFVVLLRCEREGDAQRAFERLRGNCEEFSFPGVQRLTLSIGFTEVWPTDTPNQAFERADKAVYYVKGHGRNQVAQYSQLLSCGALRPPTAVDAHPVS